MGRLIGWERALGAHVVAHLGAPFRWGENDCFTFASGAEFAITGRRSFDEILKSYETAAGALRVLRARGWRDCGDAAAEVFEEISPRLARRGDFATIETAHVGDALGVVLGDRAAAPGFVGLEFRPITRARRAWRVE